jgi:O-methyltransferase
MTADVDRILRENEQLSKEVRNLRERVLAIESSRWWRLHPRVALRRLRRRGDDGEDGAAVQEEARRAHAFPLDFERPDIELYQRVAPYTMTTPPRVYALVRAAEYVSARSIPGAFVECGVWRGGSIMAVALTLLRLGVTDRDLYLFDTFAGMTAPTEEDVRLSGERAADLLAEESADADIWAVAPLEQVREAVLGVGYPEDRIHFVQGAVEETLPESAPEEIALLRLDTDWYASTKHELVHLYPRLARGGVLILDDYGYWQGARRATDEYLAEHDEPLLLNRIDNTGRIAIKPG